MIHTPLCDLLEIEHPIIQAGAGPATSAQLAAAVSNAGALGSVANFLRESDDVQRQIDLVKTLTNRPFALNNVVTTLDEETMQRCLDARPKLMSFALADPHDYIRRVHNAGILVMHQVTTVEEAKRAAENGVDIIVAQGGESGGYSGRVSTMVLVPQVVDAVRPLPVVAAGGIYDGRGLAAALMLGAVGVNMGTRFLASDESPITEGHKRAITGAASQDAVPFGAFNDIFPQWVAGGYNVVLRAIRTPFIDEWEARRNEIEGKRNDLQSQVIAKVRAGRGHEVIPAAGQSSGGITETKPAAQIVSDIMAEAEAALGSSRVS